MASVVPLPLPAAPSSSPAAAVAGPKDRWVVHKFGGTSLATADRYRNCAKLAVESLVQLEQERAGNPNYSTCASASASPARTALKSYFWRILEFGKFGLPRFACLFCKHRLWVLPAHLSVLKKKKQRSD